MPRAVDPSLIGQQLPIDHSPLNRIEYRVTKPKLDLEDLLGKVITFIEDYLFPAIEDLTGIDLSEFLPLLNLLDFDYTSPTAFLTSLVNSITALPAVLINLLTGLIEQLTHPANSDQLTALLTSLLTLLVSLPGLLTQLVQGLVPWFDIEGANFLNGALDGIDLEPGAIAKTIRDAIGSALEDIPLLGEITQPLTGLVGQIGDLETHFINLRNAITADLDELNLPVGEFDPTAMITRLIDDRIKPLEKLAELVGGLLPDSQKPQWLQDVTDNIHNAYANLGDPLDINRSPISVLNSIFGIFSTGLGASAVSSMLTGRLAALESTVAALPPPTGPVAHTITIDFAGSSSSSLGSNWDVDSAGGGGGSMGLDGGGNMVWQAFGASSRRQVGHYIPAALATDNGIIEVILSSSPQSPLFDDAFTYMNFRMNVTNDTYTRLRIGYGGVRMQAVVSDTAFNLTGDAAISPKAGDRLRVVFGEPGGVNPLHFVVSLNGNTISGLNFTDTSGTAQYGSSYLHIGAGMETGNRLIITQNIPPGLAVLNAVEVL